jgi:hypothetical protein
MFVGRVGKDEKYIQYRILVVETEEKGPLEIAQGRWEVRVK